MEKRSREPFGDKEWNLDRQHLTVSAKLRHIPTTVRLTTLADRTGVKVGLVTNHKHHVYVTHCDIRAY